MECEKQVVELHGARRELSERGKGGVSAVPVFYRQQKRGDGSTCKLPVARAGSERGTKYETRLMSSRSNEEGSHW